MAVQKTNEPCISRRQGISVILPSRRRHGPHSCGSLGLPTRMAWHVMRPATSGNGPSSWTYIQAPGVRVEGRWGAAQGRCSRAGGALRHPSRPRWGIAVATSRRRPAVAAWQRRGAPATGWARRPAGDTGRQPWPARTAPDAAPPLQSPPG